MSLSLACARTAALTTAYLAAGAVCQHLPAELRPAGSLLLLTTLSMGAAALAGTGPRSSTAAVGVATVLALAGVYYWRRVFDPAAVVGPSPRSLDPVVLAVLGAVNVVAAGVVAAAFTPGRRVFRVRWAAVGLVGAAVLAACVAVSRRAEAASSPLALMRRVVVLEASADQIGWGERQELSTALAALGRQREAREVPLYPDAVGRRLSEPPPAPASPAPFPVTPWREAVARVAADRRLVLVMEAHTVSEHRAWIEQTLAPFRAAGFTHYCAEAVAEPGPALTARGYPTARTGVYTLDPRFGNLVRTALSLGFDVDGYDCPAADFDGREEGQAAALAARLASRPGCRMLVHAGHGHVFKHPARHVGRYMAARLWERTGVEPFTIWQLSNDLPGDAYASLLRQLGPIAEPVVLAPPPRHLSEALFPESAVHPAVDAVVVHPPGLGREPTDRRGAVGGRLTRLSCVWQGDRWPVVIAAIADGEPDDAVPLDQIMLRRDETDFELWLPSAGCRVRVWTLDGPLAVHADVRQTPVRISVAR